MKRVEFLLLTAIMLVSISIGVSPQQRQNKTKPATNTKQENSPPILPLTEAERALELKVLVANQPDFTADEQFFASESRGGFGGAEKVARKGDSYRIDNGYYVFIYQRGKPGIRMGHGSKVYDPLFGKQDDSIVPWASVSPLALAQLTNAKLTALGAQIIDGHRCLKVEATEPSLEYKVNLYLAEDLKYLAIAIQVVGENRGSIQTLHNISLSVPASLFDLSDYQPMPLRKWERISKAQVFLGGKEVPDSSLFRAQTGEMFLAVRGSVMVDTYILRPSERTSEVAFQGHVKTDEGEYAWTTKAEVGFSGPDTPKERRLYTCRETNCPKVDVGPNYFIFSDGPKIRIRVTW